MQNTKQLQDVPAFATHETQTIVRPGTAKLLALALGAVALAQGNVALAQVNESLAQVNDVLAQITDAQDTPPAFQTPDVLVTGSRLPSTPSGLAQNITVINAQEIRAQSPARLEDILGRASGVYVDQVGKTGGFSSLYLRGAEQSHLLILIDGVKVNDPTTTRGSAYDLSSIDVAQVERIEILRGPASSIHGGEALAGVVNIVTKKSKQPGVHGSAYAGVGEENYRKIGASVSGAGEKVRAQVSAGRSLDGSGEGDAFQRLNSFSGSLGFTPTEAFSAEIFARRSERKSGAFPDNSGGPLFALLREQERRESTDDLFGAALTYGSLERVRLQVNASHYNRKEDIDSPGIEPFAVTQIVPFQDKTDFKRDSLELIASKQFARKLELAVGAAYQNEDGDSDFVLDFTAFGGGPTPAPFSLERTTKSLFAEGDLEISSVLALQLGVRYDDVEALDAETTPHVGFVWSLPSIKSTIKGSYSEGFKPPSFFALGLPEQLGGNPNLRPERSKNFELVGRHELSDDAGSYAQASVFKVEYEDLVDFTVDPITFAPLLVNRGAVDVLGTELEFAYRFSASWLGRVNVTLLDIDIKDGRGELRNRPEKKASASLEYRHSERLSGFATVNHTGRFFDVSQGPNGSGFLSDYTTLDLALTARFKPVTCTLAIDNVFDKEYEQFIGFRGQDRRVRLEVRGEF